MNSDIRNIASAGLCCGCGTCVAVCPGGAIEMRETASGFLAASVRPDACTGCGLCTEVCPSTGAARPDSAEDPFLGPVVAAYLARATHRGVLAGAQSGGAVSALLCFLLEQGRVDGAVVTEMPEDGSLRPRAFVARTREDVLRARGSQYCPVAVNALLSGSSSLALVGLPCHVEGLRRMEAALGRTPVSLTIGLVCDRVLSYAIIDHLTGQAGCSAQDLRSLRFRDKGLRGRPGDVLLRTRDGRDLWLDRSRRMAAKDAFTPARCRLCPDKMNVLSDLVVGDPWGFDEDAEGRSMVLTRTAAADALLNEAARHGDLELRRVPAEDVFRGQNIAAKRRDWAAFRQAWLERGGELPARVPADGTPTPRQLRRARRELQWAEAVRRAPSREAVLDMVRRRLKRDRLVTTPRRLAGRALRIVRRCHIDG